MTISERLDEYTHRENGPWSDADIEEFIKLCKLEVAGKGDYPYLPEHKDIEDNAQSQ